MSKANDAILSIDECDKTRFFSKVKEYDNGCWEWQGAKSKLGYGVFSIGSTWVAAHRAMFYIRNGFLPDRSLVVMHDCENPKCCNPNHLVAGTIKQNGNYVGCIEKLKNEIRNKPFFGKRGKDHVRWGMKHSKETIEAIRQRSIKRQKLTDEQINEIYNSKGSSNTVGREYGISGRLVRTIRKGTYRSYALKP